MSELNICDVKTLVSCYKYIERNVSDIDEFIYRHAINYGPNPELYSTFDVINNIVDLMERKNKLRKLKYIIDESVESIMDEMDRQILLIKMRYRPSIKTLQSVLKIASERTTFRRLEHAYQSLMHSLNRCGYSEKIKEIIDSESWIYKIKCSLKSVEVTA